MAVFKLFLSIFLFAFCIGHSFSLVHSSENLPILKVVLGPEECPWSRILKETVLNDPEFTKPLQDVVMGIDENPKGEYPLFLLLDPQGKEFARLGFLPFEANEYGKKIRTLIDDFEEICTFINSKPLLFDEKQFKELYSKAKTLSTTCYRDFMRELGVKKEKGNYFHLEKYAFLLEKLDVKHPVVTKFKRKILQRNKSDEGKTAFALAVLEFQKLSSLHDEQAAKPLTRYIRKYEKEKENCQKAEILLRQRT